MPVATRLRRGRGPAQAQLDFPARKPGFHDRAAADGKVPRELRNLRILGQDDIPGDQHAAAEQPPLVGAAGHGGGGEGTEDVTSPPPCRRGRPREKKPIAEPVAEVEADGERFRAGDDVYVRKLEPGGNGGGEESSDAEEEECRRCSGPPGGGGAVMLECDVCLGGFHLACLDPPLAAVPPGDWACAACSSSGTGGPAAATAAGAAKAADDDQRHLERRRRRRTLRERFLAQELFAARILRLWRVEGGRAGCCVRWYMLPEEAHCGRQRHHGARELFLSAVEDDIQVASIVRPCRVLPLAAFRAAADGGDDVYFCEYEYDAAWQRFSRLPAEADGGNKGASGSSSGSDFDGGGGLSSSSPSEDDSGSAMASKRRRRRQLAVDGRAPTKKRGSSRRAAVAPSLKAANLRRHRHAGGARVGSAEIPVAARQPLHDPFDRARAALALAAAPKSLPCRERERVAIDAFLEEAIADGGTHCLGVRSLYVSGVPGTGKTATVMGVLRNMARRAAAGELPPFQLADINGLRLPSPQHLYSVLYESLTGQRVSHKVALKQLESIFASGGGGGSSGAASQRQQRQRWPCILLVDELDLLMTKKQTVLYNLFNWPTLPGSQLVVVGIANTMDLPERLLPRILSRLGLTRVAFTPYTRQQLQAIVAARLQESPVFDAQAVELASRKVAAVSGDVRRALELCRRAVEVAQARTRCATTLITSTISQAMATEERSDRVGMADIDVAIRETFQAPHMLVGAFSTLAPSRTVACLAVNMDKCKFLRQSLPTG
eukprot:SM000061S19264  [mRNA]  locus=s61:425523:429702:- [translate_table: standard]